MMYQVKHIRQILDLSQATTGRGMGLPGLWYNIGIQERLFTNTTSTSGSRSFCSLPIVTGSSLVWKYGIWFTKRVFMDLIPC